MNGQVSFGKSDNQSTAYPSKPQWREASRCGPSHQPLCPEPKPPKSCENCETIRENNSKETWILMNSSESTQRHTDLFTRLAWGLLGLASLLFLTSLLGSMFMFWTFAKTANNNNASNTSKEITNNTTTKEITRITERDPGSEDGFYYYPPARW